MRTRGPPSTWDAAPLSNFVHAVSSAGTGEFMNAITTEDLIA